jgi:hypothetical protein
MAPVSIINFLANEDTQRLAAGFFITHDELLCSRRRFFNMLLAQGIKFRSFYEEFYQVI